MPNIRRTRPPLAAPSAFFSSLLMFSYISDKFYAMVTPRRAYDMLRYVAMLFLSAHAPAFLFAATAISVDFYER